MRGGVLLLAGLLLAGLNLSGCAPATRNIAVFSPAPAQSAASLPLPLLLAPIDSATVYMSKDLLYRPGYADNQLHPYGNSRWVAPPVAMFGTALRQTGGDNLRTLDQSPQLARCALHIELTGFEQVFSDAQHSHAEVGVNFALVQLRNRRELAHSKLRIEIPAQSADAQGGATALEQASHQAASQIIAWLNRSLAASASGGNPLRTACER